MRRIVLTGRKFAGKAWREGYRAGVKMGARHGYALGYAKASGTEAAPLSSEAVSFSRSLADSFAPKVGA